MLACTGLVDRWTAHLSAGVSALAFTLVLGAGVIALPRRERAIVSISVGGLVVIGVVTTTLFAVRALDSRNTVSEAAAAIENALDAARDGADDTARQQLARAGSAVEEALSSLDTWWLAPTRLTPVAAPNARTTIDTLTAVDDALESLTDSLDSLRFDALSFDDGRVDLDEVDRLHAELSVANTTIAELDAVTSDRSVWLVDALVERLDRLQSRLTTLSPALDDATAVLDVLPEILGAEGDRRYLMVFVQPAESRGGGGFPGNWAEMAVRDGVISLDRQGRISELNPPTGTQWSIVGHDEYLGRYDDYRVRSQWQNLTMSPHFPTVADVMSQVYPQATGRPVDGVIRVGPPAVAALLRITGPVQVDGREQPLTADEAVEFLTRTQYSGVFADNQERIDYLGDTVEAVFDVLTAQGIGNPVTAARQLTPAIDSGDIAMWLPDRDEYELVERLAVTGALPRADDGDVFAVTQHDLLPNKIDAWSQRSITYDVQVDADTGTVQGVLGIVLRNDAPVDGTDLQVGGQRGLPRATMRELLTIYSPSPLVGVTVDGVPAEVLVQSEQGYLTHQVEVIVASGESVTVEGLVYRENAVGDDGVYRLSVPPNPAVNPDRLRVTVNNQRLRRGVFDHPISIACRPTPVGCVSVPAG